MITIPTIPTPNIWFKLLGALLVAALLMLCGWYPEHLRFQAYQEKVVSDGKVQEQHNKDLEKQRELENAKKDADYANQLANIKSMYIRMHDTGGSKLSGPSATLVSVNGYTTDPIFAEQCADTTAQLISLQQWVKDQVGIK